LLNYIEKFKGSVEAQKCTEARPLLSLGEEVGR
jgi:hypothetical protein